MVLASVQPAAADTAKLHLVWTNDIHGHVAPEGAWFMNPNFPPPLGGGASASRYIQELRAEIAADPHAAMLLVDAGDTWQGAPVGTLTQGVVMEHYFDALGYDVVVPGNHEFDKGKHVAIRMSGAMQRKFVCANIFIAGTDSLVDWCEPYRVFERAGLRIGIVGANTPGTAHMAFEENIAGLEFRPLLPEIEKWRDHLLQNDLADLVFAVVHEGLPFDPEREWKELQARVAAGEDLRANLRGAMDLAHVLDGVPVVVGGHTHRGYREPWIDPITHTMVLETFGNGSSLGHIVLNIDRDTHAIAGWEAPRRDGVLVTLFEDELWPEDVVSERLQPFVEETQKGLDVKVGASRVELTRRGGSNSPMGNLVTEAMRAEANADFAFTNLGGLRADIPAGDITAGEVLRVLPFDNSLAIVQMPGRTIRQIFERKSRRGSSGIAQSGAQVIVDPEAPEGERVRELLIGGQPIEADRVYRVVTTDYLMDGNSGLAFLAQTPPDQIEFTQTLDRVALLHYLERSSPVAPHADDRWRERSKVPLATYLQNWTLP
jgi:2',3'-cyclic-nucleotide 2'-phosphodiesterase (5'-nucleotidase family)